jgi:hypothetical protein
VISVTDGDPKVNIPGIDDEVGVCWKDKWSGRVSVSESVRPWTEHEEPQPKSDAKAISER